MSRRAGAITAQGAFDGDIEGPTTAPAFSVFSVDRSRRCFAVPAALCEPRLRGIAPRVATGLPDDRRVPIAAAPANPDFSTPDGSGVTGVRSDGTRADRARPPAIPPYPGTPRQRGASLSSVNWCDARAC